MAYSGNAIQSHSPMAKNEAFVTVWLESGATVQHSWTLKALKMKFLSVAIKLMVQRKQSWIRAREASLTGFLGFFLNTADVLITLNHIPSLEFINSK